MTAEPTPTPAPESAPVAVLAGASGFIGTALAQAPAMKQVLDG